MTGWVRRYRIFILLAITALGAFLRLFRLDSLPPGDGYDVAQYGLDALQILDGARPIFLAANFGREALFSYLVAAVYLFSGSGALGIHLSSALIGIATIPAVYFAARELLAGEEETIVVWGSLLAALVTAVSYWHINYSRAGLRVIWVPLFAALISGFLWRGLRRDSRISLGLAGLLLGLSQYTYQAARLLPLLVLGGFLFFYLARRSFSRRDLVNVILTFGLALLAFAPLGLFALDQPEVFNDRLRQTALLDQETVLANQVAEIADQALVALRMFFIEGDNEPLYTIPGRPSLNPFLALAFLAGITICLWRWKRDSMLYLLTWLLLLSAPAMIADRAATAKRALGAFPAAAILIALGMVVPYLFLSRRASDRARWLAPVYRMIIALGLISTTAVTYNDYFRRWGEDPALAAHFERDHTEVGLAVAEVGEDEAVLVSPFPASHPAIQLNSKRHPDLRSYDGHRCLIVPNTDDKTVHYIIVPGETEASLERLLNLFPAGTITIGPQRPDRDEPYFKAFHVPAGSSNKLPEGEALRTWEDKIALVNIDIKPERPSPGDTLTITLTYEVLQDIDANYTAYVHLIVEGDDLVGQVDSEPCRGAARTSTWREGDTIVDTVKLSIDKDTPPGQYRLATGFYTWPDITALELTQGWEQKDLATVEIR